MMLARDINGRVIHVDDWVKRQCINCGMWRMGKVVERLESDFLMFCDIDAGEDTPLVVHDEDTGVQYPLEIVLAATEQHIEEDDEEGDSK